MENPNVPPRCARCLRPLAGDNIIISPEGDAVHQRCWNEPKRTTRSVLESDRLCPVCLQPIQPTDKVMGQGDDVIHMQCDHFLPPPSRPVS